MERARAPPAAVPANPAAKEGHRRERERRAQLQLVPSAAVLLSGIGDIPSQNSRWTPTRLPRIARLRELRLPRQTPRAHRPGAAGGGAGLRLSSGGRERIFRDDLP